MTKPNSINSTPARLPNASSPSAFERIRNSVFSCALSHILNPLGGLLRFLIAGVPKSLMIDIRPFQSTPAQHQVPAVQTTSPSLEDDQSDNASLERSRESSSASSADESRQSLSSDSVSTGDAIEYKLIHYQAALQVVNDLLAKADDSNKAALEQLSVLIDQSADALRAKQTANLSSDNASVQKDIGGQRKRSKMLDVFRHFKREQTKLVRAGREGADIPEQTRHVHIRTALASVIHGKFRALGLRERRNSIEEIDRQIFDRYIDVLQTSEWNNITKTHALRFPDQQGNTQTLKFKTTMTAAKNMDDVLKANYQADGVNGICSYAIREHRHAANLWKTEFRPEQTSADGTNYEFSGLRHGVHDAYGIKDNAERANANDARVQEFIHASVLEHLARNNLSPDALDPEQILDIDIVSVNLLTPASKEKDMILYQQQAFMRANNKEIQIQITDQNGKQHKLKVKPKIIMFSTPVNHLSLSKTGSMIGLWRTADSINKKAIIQLIGSTDNSKAISGMAAARIQSLKSELAKTPLNTPERAKRHMEVTGKILLIQQLTTQIKDIYTNKTHHRVGNEPYKLPTRLLALANEIGATPAFNCKSGKDRTGQLNVEIRDLYAHLNASNGQMRDVNVKRENLAQENFQQMFFAGGDRELQTLNTGAPGSKSQLPYYNQLMGVTPKTIDDIKGLSKWVGT